MEGKKAKGRIAKRAATKKPAPKTTPTPSIQDVVVALIREHGKPAGVDQGEAGSARCCRRWLHRECGARYRTLAKGALALR